MREFGQGDYTIDIAKVDLETMKEKMKRLLAERLDAQRRVEETGNIYRSKLSEQYDRVFGLVTEEGI